MAAPAEAAAPVIVMVSGEPLDEPVVFAGFEETVPFAEAIFEGGSIEAVVKGRPSLELALFWNDRQWEPYLRRLDELRPEQANQFGRFYPAFGGEPAAVEVEPPAEGPWPRRASDELLALFRARGVRVSLPEGDGHVWWWVAAGVAGTAALAVALLRRFRPRAAG